MEDYEIGEIDACEGVGEYSIEARLKNGMTEELKEKISISTGQIDSF